MPEKAWMAETQTNIPGIILNKTVSNGRIAFLSADLYRQPHRMILHIVNLSNPGAWRQPIDEFIPIGPVGIKVRMHKDTPRGDLRSLIAGRNILSKMDKGWLHF